MNPINRQEIIDLFKSLATELERAVHDLQSDIFPSVRLPRPRLFHLAPGIIWPYVNRERTVARWEWFIYDNNMFHICKMPDCVVSYLAYNGMLTPSHITRVIKRWEAAIRWCRNRRKGMERHAAEVLAQQQRACQSIQSRIALHRLARRE